MFKKVISAVIALTMVMGMCSCSESSSDIHDPSVPDSSFSEPSDPSASGNVDAAAEFTANYKFVPTANTTAYDQQFVSGMNSFSVELFKQSVMKDLSDGRNTLVSPESVAFALGMLQNGADGSTLKQMQDTMCKGVSQDVFNSNMNMIMTNTNSGNTENTKLSIANSVWVKDNEKLIPTEQFTRSCKELYGAEMYKAAFDDTTKDQVNSWVNEKTDKMIPAIIDHFTGEELMCLVNCVAFDSKWEDEYKDTQVRENQKFTNANGDEVSCTMLTSTEKQYISGNKAQGFIKNYEGGKYAFMAILPDEDISIKDYVSSLTADEFAKLYASKTTKYDVYTKIPQFKYDHSLMLESTLQNMGITEAFTDSANFSKLFENTPAKISKVIHKTHIELDAKGTKAAAATVITTKEATAALDETETKTVYLDRPFVYAIMDTTTGLPVFMGTVCDPSVQ